ncbi:unnamed protein product (macronuclear) [Paramecium tetraurelia]|uniref:Uncharacterized protein n=1 Tax=Paramecium tetraurelia TaxID=5888 RepID=A0CT84_PARTE|nr:uncharacterized protein GSPATT00010235001 [Paramecium tetraurelia]CAK74001.1 unnamed protein product [Paramecium tetraurelia]|eukprot:XP_001441398.1 hypothetical protein (macronuclear) [Paramecium tetraurelia strain d4-2]
MIEIQKIIKSTPGDNSNKTAQNKFNHSTKPNNNSEVQKDFLKLQAILESKPKSDKTSKSNPPPKAQQQKIPELKTKEHNGHKQNNNVITKKHDEQKKQTNELVVKQKENEKVKSKHEISKFENIQKQIKTNPQQIPNQKKEKESSYQPLKIHKPLIKEKVASKDEEEINENGNQIVIQKKNQQNNEKQESTKKTHSEIPKQAAPQSLGGPSNQSTQQQLPKKDLGDLKLMQLLQNSSKTNTKKKSKSKDQQEQGKSKDLKHQSQQPNQSLKKDKIKDLQNQKSKPFPIKPQIKDLSIQKINKQKNLVNDDYDLNDSFINDSESVDVEIDPNEIVSELKKLQRKKEGRKQSDFDDDIEEAGFDIMQKEEKKSRVLGIIDDYREEKYIKKEIKKEKKHKKKLLEMKNKQENKKTDEQ